MLFAPKEKGQGLVEYAIILALVAIVVIAVMRLLGPKNHSEDSVLGQSPTFLPLIFHLILLFWGYTI